MARATESTARIERVLLHQRPFRRGEKIVLLLATFVIIVTLSLVPQGSGKGRLHGEVQFDPRTGTETFEETANWEVSIGVWAGAIAGYILLLSPITGHRPLLRRWLPPKKWRRVHTSIGISILVFSGAHAAALIAVGAFYTWPSGTAAFAVLALHGASAAFKQRLVQTWGAQRWRFIHIASGWTGLVLGIQHAVGMNLALDLWAR